MSRQVIWKFRIDPSMDKRRIVFPNGMQPLCVQVQNGHPHMWGKLPFVDWTKGTPPEETQETRLVHIVTTGEPRELSERAQYVGTFQIQEEGGLVFHLFLE